MRNLQVSYFRVIAMLMVVCYHCLCYYGIWSDSLITNLNYIKICKFINSIDMPVFFFISAYLYTGQLENCKYNDTISFIKKKFKRLLIPYFIWAIVINLIFIDRYHFKSILTGISHLWFLLTLMMIFLIVHLTRKKWFKMSILSLWGIVFILFVIAPLRDLISINILRISQILQYLPFFFVGIIFARYKEKIPSYPIFNVLIVLLLALYILFFFCFHNTESHFIKILTQYIIIPLSAIIIISSSWILCRHIRFKEVDIIQSLDKNSMGIYIIHHILIIAAIENKTLSVFIVNHDIIAPIVLFIATLLISWLTSLLLNQFKFSSYLLG